MDQHEVRSRAYSMPLSSPAFPRGPYRFRDREYLIIGYRTDPARLRALIPEPLQPVDDIVKYEFIRMPDANGFGDYTESGQVVAMLQQGGFRAKPVMSNADPPVHTRIRKYTWQAFTPKRIAQLEPEVRRLVTRFLDQIEGAGRADLVRQMFYELQVLVLFIFLGMPEEDVARVKTWSRNRLMLTWGRLSDEQRHKWTEVVGTLRERWQAARGALAAMSQGQPLDEVQRGQLAELESIVHHLSLEKVKDDTVWRKDEADAWFRLLDLLRSSDLAELERAAFSQVLLLRELGERP